MQQLSMSLKQLGRIHTKFISVVISRRWQLRMNLLFFISVSLFSPLPWTCFILTIWKSMEIFLHWTKERFYSSTKISRSPWLSRIAIPATPVLVSSTIRHAGYFSPVTSVPKAPPVCFRGEMKANLRIRSITEFNRGASIFCLTQFCLLFSPISVNATTTYPAA